MIGIKIIIIQLLFELEKIIPEIVIIAITLSINCTILKNISTTLSLPNLFIWPILL